MALRSIWRDAQLFQITESVSYFSALAVSSTILICIWFFSSGSYSPPRSVILADFVFSFILVCGFRLSMRVIRERYLSGGSATPHEIENVAIVGAGDVGETIASDLLSKRGLGMRPVVFLDDDETKWNLNLHGIKVINGIDRLNAIKRKYGIEKIIIAMPSAPAWRVKEVIIAAQQANLKAEIVPSLAQLTTGTVRANRLRPVEVEDLLGREPVKLDSENIQHMIQDKVVMVTGAGGSIGSELCRQVVFNNPRRLLMVEKTEGTLFQIEEQLKDEGYGSVVLPLVADILDKKRMDSLFQRFQPQIVFHAAAHKHVHMMERQPGEAIKNNTLGTELLADLASKYSVEHFILISTDKAINPTSVMGVSKRMAEIYIQTKQNKLENKTHFMAVRFGNVLGSSNSVVPIFKKQIDEGGPVTITHPDVTRYFMTVPESVGLILQAATQGKGGEIFVLDMGETIKIVDLAKQMIELSGFRPGIDIDLKYIGLRPGEKLFEEYQHIEEMHEETEHPRIFRFANVSNNRNGVEEFFNELKNNGMLDLPGTRSRSV